MLELQLPHPMPHALPPERSFDFYLPRPVSKYEQNRPPLPRPSSDTALRLPPTPPSSADMPGTTVGSVSLYSYGTQVRDPGMGNRTVNGALPPFPSANGHGYQLPSQNVSKPIITQTSPTPQRGSSSEQDLGHRRKTSNSSIAPNLKTPSTIDTPQEGLPQLAAEVTCLFWFESSATLRQVLKSGSPRAPIQALVPDAIPTTGFRKWVATILTTTQVAQNVILLALMFIYRLKQINPSVKGKPGSEYRLLTVALMLGNKFLDDNTYTNKTWAEVSGISVQEVHIMEVEFLSNMRYSLYTSKKEWEEWHTTLGKFGTFFDRASKLPMPGVVSPGGPPISSLQLPLGLLPSPPTSQHTSPPTTMSYSPTRSMYSNTPLLQPQTTSTVVSPIGPLPELAPLNGRKRSWEQGTEPPPKRQAHGFGPTPYCASHVIPSLQAPMDRPLNIPSSMPRLPPLPSLSIPPPQNNQAPIQLSSSASLPVPGSRAMSMVYPPVQWSQQYTTPTSTAPPAFPPSHTPTAGERSRQVSPYPPSAGSSPVSATFPSNQRQSSPSYFLSQRQSPYRPVRGVTTLLVPPPSASMHNLPHIGFDQMQYQSLGRPNNERHAGLLPYMHHEAWPQTNQFNQFPVLPQPNFLR